MKKNNSRDYQVSLGLKVDNHKEFIEFLGRLCEQKEVKSVMWDNSK